MGSSILSIGQSALAAAQVGISTTGHNIANASTPGYSRQLVTQNAATAQNFGYGFIGQGTEISSVKRIYSDYLGGQVNSAQSSSSGLDAYYNQIKQIDNMLGDSSAGLSPAIQNFFKGINDLAANPSAVSARQATLSSAEALASSFQSMDGRFDEIRQGVNLEIAGTVDTINNYAKQIAELNASIGKLQGATGGNVPNDLYDQRDQLVQDLSKEVKVSVVKQDGGNYSIYIGNGQALVAGVQSYNLKATPKAGDLQNLEVSYQLGVNTVALAESSLNGGKLGGLFDFRSQILNVAQDALGNLAQSIATTFNAQHSKGQDLNGNPGGDFFTFVIPAIGTPPRAKNFSVAIGPTDTSKIAAAEIGPIAVGDNRNALLLAGLQTSNNAIGGTTTYQGAYSQLVSLVGNKTREIQVTGASEKQRLSSVVQTQQSVSGVNLDEEASNLLRYQQAYQAAGKVMQIASDMFAVLLTLGR